MSSGDPLSRSTTGPDDTSRISTWVTEHRDEIVGVVEGFIAIASENRPPSGDERAFQEHLAELLRSLGMEVDTFLVTDAPDIGAHPLFWPGRSYGDRPNVVGRRPGSGGGQSLVFAGHGDVVPGLVGEYPPYKPVVCGNRLYGRGASDMKGGLAAAVMAVRCLEELRIELPGDLLIECVVDEEMAGSNGTLASRLRGNNPDGAVLMEPTGMRVCPSHRGGRVYQIRIRGAGGMGFGGMELVSPLHAMARLLVALEPLSSGFVTPSPALDASPIKVVVSHARAASFEAGQATGVPQEAVIEVWVEVLEGTTAEDADRAFLAFCQAAAAADPLLSRCEIGYESITRFIPGASIDDKHGLVEASRRALGAVLGPSAVVVEPAPFACDGFLFGEFGVPVVILGPTGDNAHAPDEFVLIDSVLDLTATLANIAVDWCTALSSERTV